jgi:hypothetical protein
VVVTHPKITRPDQVSSTQDSFSAPLDLDTVYAGWSFDQSWEMQPGDWVIAFTYQGETLVSASFTITVPDPSASICAAKLVS